MKRTCVRAAARRRLMATTSAFLHDEQGGATIWNLTWLLVFAGMAGLSIDASNGYRNIAISQSSADAASLAGVLELPNPLDEVAYDETDPAVTAMVARAKASAIEYARSNMDIGIYGDILRPDEVFIGNWYNPTGKERRFTSAARFQDLVDDGIYSSVSDVTVNAVRVYLFQDEADRGNGVATSLMHMVGVPYWTVVTTSTAQIGWDTCADHAMMTEQKFCENNHTEWGGDICLYAEEGFKLGPNNDWNGNEVRSRAGADNSQIHENNLNNPNFNLSARDPSLNVPHVQQIPFIANQVLNGGTIYTQPKNTVVPGTGVIKLKANTKITGTAVKTSNLGFWPSVQVADLGGFASVGSLLGLSAKPTTPPGQDKKDPDPGTEPDPGGGNDDTTLKNCNGGKSPGTDVTPVQDFDKEVLGLGDDIEGNEVTFDPSYSSSEWADPVLAENRIYLHEGNKLEINGDISNVTIVTTGTIEVANGATLSDVTLVGLDDKKGLVVNGNVGGESGVKFGTVDQDLCDENGAVKIYTIGSMVTPAKTTFNGALLASGGTIGFAGQASAPNGVALYAAGHIVFTSNPGGGGSKREINSCGVPITIGDEDLRISIVD